MRATVAINAVTASVPEESTMGAVPVPGAGGPEAGTVPISAVDESVSLHASAHVIVP